MQCHNSENCKLWQNGFSFLLVVKYDQDTFPDKFSEIRSFIVTYYKIEVE